MCAYSEASDELTFRARVSWEILSMISFGRLAAKEARERSCRWGTTHINDIPYTVEARHDPNEEYKESERDRVSD